ncbi:hypothetical protein MOQ72_34095 [Saccharopolyspora sp. K220]|uniref:ParB/RepB/Spo0J family partition protein n=1 Tax=Saccharopolyspora soli TaxID=2926618 RepID=UPI001F58BC42|nr:hypothetical protein [Saccharopolyspora soli]MCI2422471.1 hypothetical protein [Saccharopolyspora soli]
MMMVIDGVITEDELRDQPHEVGRARYVDLNPRHIGLDGNAREVVEIAKNYPGFVKSIANGGVKQDVVVDRLPNGEIHARYGHRRVAGSCAADLNTVTAKVIDVAELDLFERRKDQVMENDHRVGFTTAERAHAYNDMALFGFTADDLADQLGADPDVVKASLTVAASTNAQQALQKAPQLDVETAVAFEEFAEWPDALDALNKDLDKNPDQLPHTIALWRRRIASRQRIQAKADELREQGYTVYTELPDTARPVRELLASKTDPIGLTTEGHESCEGHGVLVTTRLDDEVMIKAVCLDWRKHGHLDRFTFSVNSSSGSTSPSTTPEQDTAARRRVRKNNEVWRASEEVRRKFVRKLVAGKKPPKQAQRFINEALLTATYDLRRACERRHSGAITVLDLPSKHGDKHPLAPTSSTSEARATLQTLGLLLGALETELSVQTWRQPGPEAKLYFRWLDLWGYKPSTVEKLVLDPTADADEWPVLTLGKTAPSNKTDATPNQDNDAAEDVAANDLPADEALDGADLDIGPEPDDVVPVSAPDDAPAEFDNVPNPDSESDVDENGDPELASVGDPAIGVTADAAELYAALADEDFVPSNSDDRSAADLVLSPSDRHDVSASELVGAP